MCENLKKVLKSKYVQASALAIPIICASQVFAAADVGTAMTTTATTVSDNMVTVIPAVGVVVAIGVSINFGFSKIRKYAK